MKNLIILLLALLPFSNYGQVTLDHTFGKSTAQMIEANGDLVYLVYGNPVGEILLYNASYTLVQQMTFPTLPGHSFGSIQHLSTDLFDSDPGYEYLALYLDTSSQWHCYVMEENGTPSFDFGQGFYVSLQSAAGTTKVIATNATSNQSKVYSIPGTLNRITAETGLAETVAYPNPANTTVRVATGLGQAIHGGEIEIIASDGSTAYRAPLESQQSEIEISTSWLPQGSYWAIIRDHTGSPFSRAHFVIQR